METEIRPWLTMKNGILLELRNISKSFVTRKVETIQAISDINFEVNRNEFVCLLGPSGCGKTTLLRLVAGLEGPTDGGILFDGLPMTKTNAKIGMVFQEYSLFPWRNVRDNISFGLEVRGISKKKRRKISQQYINLVGLDGFEQAYPHELSGGMQQRVAVARALSNEPELLLMDEPFGSLDAQTRSILQRELLRIWSETKKTILFVTHSISEALFLADRVVMMSVRPGRILEIVRVPMKRPRDILSSELGKLHVNLQKRIDKTLI